jgi:hypothetical protein
MTIQVVTRAVGQFAPIQRRTAIRSGKVEDIGAESVQAVGDRAPRGAHAMMDVPAFAAALKDSHARAGRDVDIFKTHARTGRRAKRLCES